MFESNPGQAPRAAAQGRLAKWQARRVFSYVEDHLDARLKVPEIARSVNLSSSHFSRAFKRTFGLTVHAWVMRRRIEIAQGLMLETPHTLSEIALRCGLSDQSHLTRWFRRIVGDTPGSWRRGRYEPEVRPGADAAAIRTHSAMFSVRSGTDATSKLAI
ncbi:MAG: AraC family transcriptional regulator [Gammaproteobacteria bacterium]